MIHPIDRAGPSYQRPMETLIKPEAESARTEAAPVRDEYRTEKSVEAESSYQPDAKLVAHLKAEQAEIQGRFLSAVRDMLTRQGKQVTEGEGIWKLLAGGEYQVDAQTQVDAQAAIAEDGYWGVKQTSQRIVDFARALVGSDPSRAGEMREAFLKGFQAAEKAWGGALPEITGQTREAALALFDQWEKKVAQTAE